MASPLRPVDAGRWTRQWDRSLGRRLRVSPRDPGLYFSPALTHELSLPLDYSAIERILPHRYPFLLVDRITELEPDKRIVGIKNVSLNERYLSRQPGSPPV